jgi:hypothetical protein
MDRYSKAKIYKIVDNTSRKVYVGSTCEDTLAKRLSKHVDSYKRHLKGNYNNVTSFQILSNENYDIILIENYPCNNKDELRARERYWIENTDFCVNKNIPTRTREELDNMKVKCDCGATTLRRCVTKHLRTPKHQRYLNRLLFEQLPCIVKNQ